MNSGRLHLCFDFEMYCLDFGAFSDFILPCGKYSFWSAYFYARIDDFKGDIYQGRNVNPF